MYNELSIAVIIRPLRDKAGDLVDNWVLEPPFENDPLSTESGYIIANTTDVAVDFTDYYLLPSRFMNLSNILNSIDFMFKTVQEVSGSNISNGIGGYAKLKDFTVTLAEHGDLIQTRIAGRELEVRSYEGSSLTNDVDGLYTTHFKGTINQFSKPFDDTIDFICQGIMSNNNPRINGEPYIDNNGQVQNTFIIIGDLGKDSLVKLDKKKGAQGVQLGFDDSKYKLKNLYIKEKELDEFFEVKSGFTVNDGKVAFTSAEKVLLTDSITDTEQVFNITDYTVIGIKTNIPHTFGNYLAFQGATSGRVKWLKLLEVVDTDEALYTTTSSFLFKDTLSEVLRWHETDIIWRTDTQDLGGTSIAKIELIIDEIYVERESLLQSANRLETGFMEHTPGVIELIYRYGPFEVRDKWDYFYYERENIDRDPDTVSVKPEQNTVQVLKIGDEEIAVIDVVENLDYKRLSVVRGFNDTEADSHTTDEDVLLLNSESTFSPEVKIVKDLKYILRDYRFEEGLNKFDYKEWIEQSPDLPYRWDINFGVSQLQNWLHVKWELPDISGVISKAPEIKSEFQIDKLDYVVDLKNYTDVAPWWDSSCHLGVGLAMQPNENYLPDSTVGDKPDDESFWRGPADLMNSRNLVGVQWNRKKGGPWEIHNYDRINPLSFTTLGGGMELASGNIFNTKDQLVPTGVPIFKNMCMKTWSYKNGTFYDNPNFDTSKFTLKGSWSLIRERDRFDYTSILYACKYLYFDNTLFDFPVKVLDPFEYSEFRESTFALRMLKLDRMNIGLKCICNILKCQMYMYVKAPILDNEWYGDMKLLGVDINNSTPVNTLYLGDNGSLYLRKEGKEYYLFAESDQKPFVVYNLSLTGNLTLISEVTLVQQPTMGPGRLSLFDSDTNVAKISNKSTSYDYLQTVEVDDATFPVIVNDLISTNSLGDEEPVGDDEWETDALEIYYDSTTGYIKIFTKQEIEVSNPIDVLKILLEDYAKHQKEVIDDNDADPFDTTTSFGLNRVRFRDAGYKATVRIEKEINANKIVSEFCENFGLVLYEDNTGILKIANLFPPSGEDVSYTEELPLSSILFNEDKKPDYTDERLEIKHIITSLILRYSPFGDKYREEIKNDEWESVDSRIYNLIRNGKLKYTANDTEVSLNLKYTNDKRTALYCAYIKMLFHSYPPRVLKIHCLPELSEKDLGTWLTIPSNSFIPDTDGKQYVLLEGDSVEPIKGDRPSAKLTLFEFDWDARVTQIQEVYDENTENNYGETDTVTDTIQEGFEV